MSEPPQSPFVRLVLFMICIAIAGSVVAGAHYYAVDLPVQNAIQAPDNIDVQTWKCSDCANVCRWAGTLSQKCYDLCIHDCS
jgi:hypothetical protein